MRSGPWRHRIRGPLTFAGVSILLLASIALTSLLLAWATREGLGQYQRYVAYRDLQSHSGRVDSLVGKLHEVSEELKSLRTALPAENQGSFVLNTLVEEAQVRGLGMGTLTAMDEIPFKGFTELPFELELTGEFPSMLAYIHALENRGMAVQIRHLAFTNEILNRSQVKATIQLSVFSPFARGGT
jgi:Tfp pilus assembly protein PilO